MADIRYIVDGIQLRRREGFHKIEESFTTILSLYRHEHERKPDEGLKFTLENPARIRPN
jgi:hypothetical protein